MDLRASLLTFVDAGNYLRFAIPSRRWVRYETCATTQSTFDNEIQIVSIRLRPQGPGGGESLQAIHLMSIENHTAIEK